MLASAFGSTFLSVKRHRGLDTETLSMGPPSFSCWGRDAFGVKCWASGSTVLLGTADGSDLLGLSPSASGTHTHKTSFFIPVTVWFCFLLFFLTVTQSNRVKSMSAFESRAS